MKLLRIFAGLGILALAPWLSAAQHSGASAHAGGVSHPVGTGAAHPSAAGRPAVLSPPLAGVQIQHGRVVYAPLLPGHIGPSWRFPQVAPVPNPRFAGFGPLYYQPRHWILRPEFDIQAERFRRFRYYQLPFFFFAGTSGPICNPFWPGYFGPQLWYDNQFSCFGVPFFGVGFYPSNFLAPDLAYEPWFENLPSAYEQRIYPSTDGQASGALDMTAAIATRESADSNPSVQVTQLVLKEGFIFGLTDYWVEGNTLHYVTAYGRQNAVDLDLVDLEKTIKLNSDRGIPFVLRERPAQPPAP